MNIKLLEKPLFLFAFLFWVSFQAHSQNKVAAWLNHNAMPINTVEAGNGFEDLQSLRKILENKRIVALGEATHGTKDFFQMKHRIVEYLAEEMGFRLFGIEASFSETMIMNDYVMYGKGDVKAALSKMQFWTWNTQEVLDMALWMRAHNEGKHDSLKIKFYGFDMQYSEAAANSVINFLQKHDTVMYQNYQPLLEELVVIVDNFDDLRKKDILLKKETISDLATKVETKRDFFISRSDSKEYELFWQHLNILSQFLDLYSSSFFKMYQVRDKYMAENIRWILNHEGSDSKIAIWAHNGHIWNSHQKIFFVKNNCMGHYMHEMFGEKYYAIGFDFNKGAFNAVSIRDGLKEFIVSDAKENKGTHILSQCNYPVYFFDFQLGMKDEYMERFLLRKNKFRDIGAVFSERLENAYYAKRKLGNIYNGFIYIDSTESSKLLQKAIIGLYDSLDIALYAGKEIKLSASIKTIDTSDVVGGILFFNAKNKKGNGRPYIAKIKQPTNGWKNIEVQGMINKSSKTLRFGINLFNMDLLYIDNIELFVNEKSEWEKIEIPNSRFENDTVNHNPFHWQKKGDKFSLTVANDDTSSGNFLILKRNEE